MYDEKLTVELLIDCHFILTLIFGVILSTALAGIERSRENYLKLSCFIIVSSGFQFLAFKYWGTDLALKLYPFFIHLPLVIFLSWVYHLSYYSAILAVSTAYLCCQLTKWLGILAIFFLHEQWLYYSVRLIVTLPLLWVLVRYISPRFALLVRLPFREVTTFGLMPLVYYIYDYITTVYTKLLYSGNPLITEFLGFFLCISYLVFLYIFAQEYIAKKDLELKNRLVELKVQSTLHELTQTRQMQYQLSIMRHDMRHFMSTAALLVQQKKYDEALAYLGNEKRELESMLLTRYCPNDYINAVITKYHDKCCLHKIDFQMEINLQGILPCSELAFSIILDNGLDNAFKAVNQLPCEQAFIKLSLKQTGSKLLLSIKNTYLQKPEFENELPVSRHSGHGIGTQSIAYNCEKIGGQYQFYLEDKFFVLRVIV